VREREKRQLERGKREIGEREKVSEG